MWPAHIAESNCKARPSVTRTVRIPQPAPKPSLDIVLQEPTLLADNLGHKTWAAGYLLAKRAVELPAHVPSLRPQDTDAARLPTPPSDPPAPLPASPARPAPRHASPLALELGAGTGLAGLALARSLPVQVHLTDLPSIVDNLRANADANALATCAAQPQSSVLVFALDWSTVPDTTVKTLLRPGGASQDADSALAPPSVPSSYDSAPPAIPSSYDFVLAADPLYSPDHPAMLANAASFYLRRARETRFVVEVPIRDRHGGLVEELRAPLGRRGMQVVAAGPGGAWEEWGTDGMLVTCWWAVWAWREAGDVGHTSDACSS